MIFVVFLKSMCSVSQCMCSSYVGMYNATFELDVDKKKIIRLWGRWIWTDDCAGSLPACMCVWCRNVRRRKRKANILSYYGQRVGCIALPHDWLSLNHCQLTLQAHIHTYLHLHKHGCTLNRGTTLEGATSLQEWRACDDTVWTYSCSQRLLTWIKLLNQINIQMLNTIKAVALHETKALAVLGYYQLITFVVVVHLAPDRLVFLWYAICNYFGKFIWPCSKYILIYTFYIHKYVYEFFLNTEKKFSRFVFRKHPLKTISLLSVGNSWLHNNFIWIHWNYCLFHKFLFHFLTGWIISSRS